MEILYDLATTLSNTTQVINDFEEASTVAWLETIQLNSSSPDADSINETISDIAEGKAKEERFLYFFVSVHTCLLGPWILMPLKEYSALSVKKQVDCVDIFRAAGLAEHQPDGMRG